MESLFAVGDRIRVRNTELMGKVIEVVRIPLMPWHILIRTILDDGTEVLYGMDKIAHMDGRVYDYPPNPEKERTKAKKVCTEIGICPECGKDVVLLSSTPDMVINVNTTTCEHCGKMVSIKNRGK